MRRASIIFLVCALAVVAAGVPAAPARTRGTQGNASAEVRTRAVRGAAHARDYWTKERMRRARPAALPRSSGSGVSSRSAASATQGPIPFQRSEVTDPSDPTVRMHGRAFFTDPFDGNDYTCSATGVTSTNESLVWTAGHCVFLNTWHTNWIFVPAYDNGAAPFGEWPALYTSAPERWVAVNNIRQDVGVAVVDTVPATGATLQDTVGSRAMAFNGPRQQAYSSFGYPAVGSSQHPEFTGETEFRCDSNWGRDDPTAGGSGPLPMGIGCDMTGGSSGGGWVGADGLLYSVNSYGYEEKAEQDVMYGPYFGDVAASLYSSHEDSVYHGMAIDLRLKRHLVASGTLVAEDGATVCAAGAPILVYRRSSFGWRLVKTTRTDGFGQYSVKLKDKPGRYKVLAPQGFADDVNYCGEALSRGLRHRH